MNDKRDSRLLCALVCGIVGILILAGAAIMWLIPDWAQRGQFGDLFGAVNALFSGLAFSGVVYAIVLQRRELVMQREEMELSRKELASQNTLISAQLATMQESWTFQRDKVLREARPVFIGAGGSTSSNAKTCKFYNAGGAITDLEVDIPGGLQFSIHPTKILERGTPGTLTVKAPHQDRVPTFRVTVNYTDSLGSRQSKDFVIPENSHDWLEQPENPCSSN